MNTPVIVLAGGALALGLAACGSSSSTASSTGSDGDLTGSITVFAAASLTGTFTQLGSQFEAAHPGTKVTFSFGPSSGLATQIVSGSPADAFASASVANMTQVVDAGAAADPVDFASNQMQIAVPSTNPGGVGTLEDLAKPTVKVALCQPQVPCGTVAAEVFKNDGITVTPVTLEPDVKSVLSKVALDEVDAGVVYVTDVRAAGDSVKGIEIAPAVNASTDYPIATMTASKNPALAAAFVAYVLSPEGASVLAAAGFAKP